MIMWCVYFFVFFAVIPGISSGDITVDRCWYNCWNRTGNKCIAPARDILKNGWIKHTGYGDDEQPQLGETLYSYVIDLYCDLGFTLTTEKTYVSCQTDSFEEDFPKCVPQCQRKSPDLLSCGIGFDNEESQCLLSKQQETISIRRGTDLQCGVIQQIYTTSVVNGTEAKLEDAPWHATIYTKTTRPYIQICGGTIVSTNVIISAAHCFWNNLQKRLPAEQFAVAVGKIYRPWDEPKDTDAQKFDIKDIRIPPRFQGSMTNFQDDIAVIILETEIQLTTLIIPACLDFDYDFDDVQLLSGRKGRVSGFGLTSADGAASQVLIWAELPVVDIEQCIATAEPGFIESITSDKICAGFSNGTAVCRGDSGGGLLIPDNVGGSKRYYLRGVVSTAPNNDHLCNVYAVATFTHIIRHERFIRKALEAAPQSQSQITTTQDTTEENFTTENPVNDADSSNNQAEKSKESTTKPREGNDTATSETSFAKPESENPTSRNPNELSDIDAEIGTTTENLDKRDEIALLDSIFQTTENPVQITENQSPNEPICDNLPEEERLPCAATTTSRYTPEEFEDLTQQSPEKDMLTTEKSIVISCDLNPIQDAAACTQNGQTDDNNSSQNNDTSSNNKMDNVTSNIETQVITEEPALITNPPLEQNTNEQNSGPDDFNFGEEFESFPNGPQSGPNFDNFNEDDVELPNPGNRNNGVFQGFLNQGLLVPGSSNGQVQEGINTVGINQSPQTVTSQGPPALANRGGQVHEGINVGGLPPQPIKNTKITIYPTLISTVKPGTKFDLKPILTHTENSAEKMNDKTSVSEQYDATTEPNYENNYQAQFWQHNSPHYQHNNQKYQHQNYQNSDQNNQHHNQNYQHNNQNWQWQNWQQKEHDWQNWHSQWGHKQEYSDGYYHHTNKHGGHWWQKYHQ